MDAESLAAVLAACPPFTALSRDEVAGLAGAARVSRYAAGELVLDAFTEPVDDVLVVVSGRVELWNHAARMTEEPDEVLGPGGLFGYSAVLTERTIGPRAVAATPVVVARLPGAAAGPAFATADGARFLVERLSAARRGDPGSPAYTLVDELITSAPVVIGPHVGADAAAVRMTTARSGYAAVAFPDGRYGLVTDAVLRSAVLAGGRSRGTAVGELAEREPATVTLGDSAAEALLVLHERDADVVLVLDRAGTLRGAVGLRDLVVSAATAGVALAEQLRRAASVDELVERSARMPDLLGELLARGMASGKVITVHSAVVDAVVRRAIQLVFAGFPALSSDAFTWLSLGSNGRREAVPSSDLDAAVAFDDSLRENDIEAYRPALTEVCTVLAAAGVTGDRHGAVPSNPAFARTNAQWRAAGRAWLAHPEDGEGAIMTSLLVDGRPIHGDPGLPAVARVFGELRRHPGTMRLLLEESLSHRARRRAVRDLLGHSVERFDVKNDALLPIVNLARWAALSAGSTALPTTERLRSVVGSPMLPDAQARTLVEVFEVLQRLRLRYQLNQRARGEAPDDVVVMDRLSPIDRSIITRAVREIAAAQRRADNVALYVEPRSWVAPSS